MELHQYPEMYLWKGSQTHSRSGPWNGKKISGAPLLKPKTFYVYNFVFNQDEVYYTSSLNIDSILMCLFLSEADNAAHCYIWIEDKWRLYWSIPSDNCDNYALCEPYGICSVNQSLLCECLKGFEPKSPERWEYLDWTQGCVCNEPLNCSNGDGFVKFSALKLSDTTYTWLNESMNLDECRMVCLRNCSCTAYANYDTKDGGTGCAIWFGDFIGLRLLPEGGEDLNIRMSYSEMKGGLDTKARAAVIVTSIFVGCSLFVTGLYIFRRKMNSKGKFSIAVGHLSW